MILTAEEYAKGFIDFDADIPDGCSVEIWSATSDSTEEAPEYLGPYTDPLGSKVLSLPKQYMSLRLELKRGDDKFATPVVRKIRWERNGQTFIYSMPAGNVGPPGGVNSWQRLWNILQVAFQAQACNLDKAPGYH